MTQCVISGNSFQFQCLCDCFVKHSNTDRYCRVLRRGARIGLQLRLRRFSFTTVIAKRNPSLGAFTYRFRYIVGTRGVLPRVFQNALATFYNYRTLRTLRVSGKKLYLEHTKSCRSNMYLHLFREEVVSGGGQVGQSKVSVRNGVSVEHQYDQATSVEHVCESFLN